jgi:hypothetical protein
MVAVRDGRRSYGLELPAQVPARLHALSPAAAYISNNHWDVLAWNRLAEILRWAVCEHGVPGEIYVDNWL